MGETGTLAADDSTAPPARRTRTSSAVCPFGDRAKDTGPEPTRPFTRHLAELGVLGLVLVGVLTLLAVLLPPAHGPAPIEGIEVTKPPWPLLWVYPVEDWIGVVGILWAPLAIFAALLVVPLVDRSPEQHPRRRLPVVIGAGVVVALIVYAAVRPVASHIGMRTGVRSCQLACR
jgi:quinol-cytochrome oxidoreductase complex cytochrome b subunit